MLLIAHILIAISGLVVASYAVVKPSQYSIRASVYLLMGTIMSGTGLVVFLQTGLLRACASGLTMSALMYVGIAIARNKYQMTNTA